MEDFISNLIAGQHEPHKPGQNDNDDHNGLVDDDISLFTVTLVDEAVARDIFVNIGVCPDDVGDTTAVNRLAENEVAIENLPILLDLSVNVPQNGNSNRNNTTTPPATPNIHLSQTNTNVIAITSTWTHPNPPICPRHQSPPVPFPTARRRPIARSTRSTVKSSKCPSTVYQTMTTQPTLHHLQAAIKHQYQMVMNTT